MAIAQMVAASCLALASYFLDFDLESYTELVECYRQGEFLESARALSERPPEKIREFASEFRTATRSDLDLQAAALLHIEVIRWFGIEEPTHFEIAGLHIASMTDDERRAEFDKKSRLALGYFYYFHLRFADAGAVFEGAGPPPRDWDFRYALATLQEAMILTSSGIGSLQAAEMEYRRLLGERPEQAELHIRLAQVLWRLGRVEESLAEIKEHLPRLSDAEAPARLAAHLVLGEIHGSRGETEQALAYFRSAYAMDPECHAAAAALGLALAIAGQGSEALAVSKDFLESGGHDAFTDDPWWQYILGRAIEHRKLFSELQQELRE